MNGEKSTASKHFPSRQVSDESTLISAASGTATPSSASTTTRMSLATTSVTSRSKTKHHVTTGRRGRPDKKLQHVIHEFEWYYFWLREVYGTGSFQVKVFINFMVHEIILELFTFDIENAPEPSDSSVTTSASAKSRTCESRIQAKIAKIFCDRYDKVKKALKKLRSADRVTDEERTLVTKAREVRTLSVPPMVTTYGCTPPMPWGPPHPSAMIDVIDRQAMREFYRGVDSVRTTKRECDDSKQKERTGGPHNKTVSVAIVSGCNENKIPVAGPTERCDNGMSVDARGRDGTASVHTQNMSTTSNPLSFNRQWTKKSDLTGRACLNGARAAATNSWTLSEDQKVTSPLNFTRVFAAAHIRESTGTNKLLEDFRDTSAGLRDMMTLDKEDFAKILERCDLDWVDQKRLLFVRQWFQTCYLPANDNDKPVLTRNTYLSFLKCLGSETRSGKEPSGIQLNRFNSQTNGSGAQPRGKSSSSSTVGCDGSSGKVGISAENIDPPLEQDPQLAANGWAPEQEPLSLDWFDKDEELSSCVFDDLFTSWASEGWTRSGDRVNVAGTVEAHNLDKCCSVPGIVDLDGESVSVLPSHDGSLPSHDAISIADSQITTDERGEDIPSIVETDRDNGFIFARARSDDCSEMSRRSYD